MGKRDYSEAIAALILICLVSQIGGAERRLNRFIREQANSGDCI